LGRFRLKKERVERWNGIGQLGMNDGICSRSPGANIYKLT
jgi:hypothetical protein